MIDAPPFLLAPLNKETGKSLKAIAAHLPEAYEEFIQVTTLKGKDIPEDQKKLVKDFKPGAKYTAPLTKIRKVDHYKKLRKYYKKYGKEFLDRYYADLKVLMASMKEKHPEVYK
jgi:uncharacterized damage-inducible protein DinB